MRVLTAAIVTVLLGGLTGCSGKGGPLEPSESSFGSLSGNWQGQTTLNTNLTRFGCGGEPLIRFDGWLIVQRNGSTEVLSPLGNFSGRPIGSTLVLRLVGGDATLIAEVDGNTISGTMSDGCPTVYTFTITKVSGIVTEAE